MPKWVPVQLPSGTWAHLYEDGRIELSENGRKLFTTAAELAFVLQEFQTAHGGIPIKVDYSSWRGMSGLSDAPDGQWGSEWK